MKLNREQLRSTVSRAQAAGAFRMKGWALIALATGVGVAFIAPHQLGVVLAKANVVALAAWLGYWIDRAAFAEFRITPHSDHAECLRRAIIIGAAMIAMALAI